MTSRVLVMHVVVAGDIGGAERVVIDLASRPSDSGAEHVIALMTPNAQLAKAFANAGLRVLDRGRVRENPAAYLWRSLGPVDVAWLTSQMRRERATVAHLHTFASQVLGTRAAARSGVSVLRTEHSTRVYDDPSCWPFSRWSLRRAQAMVAISAHVQDVALAKAPWARARMRVIHNGVDTERFTPGETPASSSDGALRLVIVGRLEPRKGVDLALEAIAQAPRTTLSIVGDGDARPSLEARARALGIEDRVRFHGYLADPRPVISECDAALCSSRSEGLGIGLLEIMAMGKPVVSFRVGGVPEFVKDDENGWLAPETSVSSLAARMRDALEQRDRAPEMGRDARRTVERSFSVTRMCSAYGELYARLTAGSVSS